MGLKYHLRYVCRRANFVIIVNLKKIAENSKRKFIVDKSIPDIASVIFDSVSCLNPVIEEIY